MVMDHVTSRVTSTFHFLKCVFSYIMGFMSLELGNKIKLEEKNSHLSESNKNCGSNFALVRMREKKETWRRHVENFSALPRRGRGDFQAPEIAQNEILNFLCKFQVKSRQISLRRHVTSVVVKQESNALICLWFHLIYPVQCKQVFNIERKTSFISHLQRCGNVCVFIFFNVIAVCLRWGSKNESWGL